MVMIGALLAMALGGPLTDGAAKNGINPASVKVVHLVRPQARVVPSNCTKPCRQFKPAMLVELHASLHVFDCVICLELLVAGRFTPITSISGFRTWPPES
jgi:hypothetical protein